MPPTTPARTRVFVDADVLFAGAASPGEHGASLVVLRMSEITLIRAITSEQVITEVARNLEEKLQPALPAFRLLVSRSLDVVPNPLPDDLARHAGAADPKDLPILVAAAREGCPWLVTFNVRHFQPGLAEVSVVRPGDFIVKVRDRLEGLALRG